MDAPEPAPNGAPFDPPWASLDAHPAVTIADGVVRPLDPRALQVERTVAWIVTGVVTFGSLLALVLVVLLSDRPIWLKWTLFVLWAPAMAAFAFLLQRWEEAAHRHASYRVDELGIEIRRGVLWRQVVNVPRSRVQHTDVTQGPIERGYGLGTLLLYTAGTEHACVGLSGLDHAVALQIRDHLLPREGADAV